MICGIKENVSLGRVIKEIMPLPKLYDNEYKFMANLYIDYDTPEKWDENFSKTFIKK